MKGNLALLILFFLLATAAQLTAGEVHTSHTEPAFNTTLSLTPGKSTPRLSNGIRTVVIDAGHGGRDPGGLGKNCREKDIALNVATLLSQGIAREFPNINVVMTRDNDRFIPLDQRAQLANDNGADLFISIHANTAPRRDVVGTETFVMGNHVAGYNLRVAQRENASIQFEEGNEARYDVDPYSNEGHIMLQMHQRENQDKSIVFAGLVETAFSRSGRNSRGVKQAGFMVLKQATMPAVLIELGFMSNSGEEKYLMSAAGQQALSASILRAFGEYHASMGGSPPNNFALRTSSTTTPVVQPWVAENVSNTAIVYRKKMGEVAPPTTAQPASVSEISEYDRDRNALTIGVQLSANRNPVDMPAQGWDRLPYPVVEVRDGVYYKYQIRNCPDGPTARKMVAQLKKAGLQTVVVAYRGGRQLWGAEFALALGE